MLPRKENVVQIKTEAYGDRIIKLYQYLITEKNERVMSTQILRSGTSIGANTSESRNAQGGKDFIHKLSLALKEADETEFWLKKLLKGQYISEVGYESMHKDNEEIICLLTSIIKTMKKKINER